MISDRTVAGSLASGCATVPAETVMGLEIGAAIFTLRDFWDRLGGHGCTRRHCRSDPRASRSRCACCKAVGSTWRGFLIRLVALAWRNANGFQWCSGSLISHPVGLSLLR